MNCNCFDDRSHDVRWRIMMNTGMPTDQLHLRMQ